MIPWLNKGVDGEDDDPEFENDMLAKEALELGSTTPSEGRGHTLLQR